MTIQFEVFVAAQKAAASQTGAADGRNNLPPADARAPSAAESQIRNAYQHALDTEMAGKMAEARGALADTLGAINPERLAEPIGDFKDASNRTTTRAEGPIKDATAKLDQAQRDDNYERSISAQHARPATCQPWVYWLVLLGMLGLEAAVNGLYIGMIHPSGLIGGWAVATVIAAVGIAVAYSGGVLMRTLWDRGAMKCRFAYSGGVLVRTLWDRGAMAFRLLAIGTGVVLALGGLAYYGTIAWYRTLLAHSDKPEAAATAVIDVMLKYGPHGLRDFDSVIVLLVGLLFFVWAAVEGFHLRNRRATLRASRSAAAVDAATQAQRDVIDSFHDEIDDAHEEAKQQIEQRYDAGREAINHLDETVMQVASVESDRENLYRQYNDAFRDTVRAHRFTNQKVRTAPVPGFWYDDVTSLTPGKVLADDPLYAEASALRDKTPTLHAKFDVAKAAQRDRLARLAVEAHIAISGIEAGSALAASQTNSSGVTTPVPPSRLYLLPAPAAK